MIREITGQGAPKLRKIRAAKYTVFWEVTNGLAGQAERPNPKLLSRGEDRSLLKYIISFLLSDSEYFIEKKFGL